MIARKMPVLADTNWDDTQAEFSEALGVDRDISLVNAISAIDYKFEGKAHDALVDAENTVTLVKLLSDRKQFDKVTRPIQELFTPVEENETLGSVFADFFATIAV